MTMMDFNALREKTEQSIPLLGYYGNWDLGAIDISHADLEAWMTQYGFGKYVPNKTTKVAALKKAIIAWAKEQAEKAGAAKFSQYDWGNDTDNGSGISVSRMLTKVNSNHKNKIAFSLMLRTKDLQELCINITSDTRFIYNKTTDKVIVTFEAKGDVDDDDGNTVAIAKRRRDIERQINPLWQYYQERIQSDSISLSLCKIMEDLKATFLRKKGGAYYIPITERARLLSLKEMLEKMPGTAPHDSTLTLLALADTDGASEQLAGVALKAMYTKLESIRSDMEADMEPGKKVRRETVTGRIQQCQKLSEKAGTYAEVLGMFQDNLKKEIRETTQMLQEFSLHIATSAEFEAEEALDIYRTGDEEDA